MKSQKSAFSLVEISIILVVIGIIISGVVQSRLIIAKSNLSNAKTLTKNSQIEKIPNLVLWFETSLESSFSDIKMSDGDGISAWKNNNLNLTSKNDLTQITPANQPTFRKAIFRKAIPAVNFDGSNDFFNFNSDFFIRSSYTIFIVEQRKSNNSNLPLIGGTGSGQNKNMSFGYVSGDRLVFGHRHFCSIGNCGDTITYTIGNYSQPIPRIHTVVHNAVNGVSYWLNGGNNADVYDSDFTDYLEEFPSPTIGRNSGQGSSTGYFNGDVGEIIIFNRALKTNERQAVESYLSSKYDIKIQ
jgi:hypothetical protein